MITRRSLFLGSAAVILTPGLLMPLRVTDRYLQAAELAQELLRYGVLKSDRPAPTLQTLRRAIAKLEANAQAAQAGSRTLICWSPAIQREVIRMDLSRRIS